MKIDDLNKLVEGSYIVLLPDADYDIKDSVEYAFVQGNDRLTSEDIKEAIRNTNSLSVIMKDSISQMRKEYDRRKLKNASK